MKLRIILVLTLCGWAFGQNTNPADAFVHMNAGTPGNALTTTILNSGTDGLTGWTFAGGSSGFTVGSSGCTRPSNVQVISNGHTYAAGTNYNSVVFNDSNNIQEANLNISSGKRQLTIEGCITINITPTPTNCSYYDLVKIETTAGTGGAVLQFQSGCTQLGSNYFVNVETWGGSTGTQHSYDHGELIPVTQGTKYWYSLTSNMNAGTDPANPSNGSSDLWMWNATTGAFVGHIREISNASVDIGRIRFGNGEIGTGGGTTTFEHMTINYSQAPDPIYPVAPAWAGVIDPQRAIDWSAAGASIINRTVACTTQPTLTANLSDATTATNNWTSIVAAFNADKGNSLDGGNGCVINFPAGTFWIDPASQFSYAGNANVTLRGAGSSQTIFKQLTVYGCSGNGGQWCFNNGGGDSWSSPAGTSTWSSGYRQGATTLTFSAATNISYVQTGSLLILDQANPTSDTGNIFVCDSVSCARGTWTGFLRSERHQAQQVLVVSCVGANSQTCSSGSATAPYTVTVTPGLYAPNWNQVPGTSTPGAWWSQFKPLTGVGMENFTVDYSSMTGGNSSNANGAIYWKNVYNSWIKGVASINRTDSTGIHKHVWLWQSSHNTVRDSYFYGGDGTPDHYGVSIAAASCDNLIENTISQHQAGSVFIEGGTGNVEGYNYDVDNYYDNGAPDWQRAGVKSHSGGNSYNLIEGQNGITVSLDNNFGTSFMNSVFRSYLNGRDQSTNPQAKTQTTYGLFPYALNRYTNVLGSVLGTQSYHTIYQSSASSPTDAGSSTNANHSVFVLGYSAETGTKDASINNDLLSGTSLIRWGNYAACTGDAACNAVRWQTSEVSSSIVPYGNPVPPAQSVPNSLYLSAEPSWWGTVLPWPPVGPDVDTTSLPSSLKVANVGNHVALNPAANCYLNVMGGLTNGSSGALAFDANTCYVAGSPSVSVMPSSLTFSSQNVGTTSSPQSVTLTNIGSVDILVNSIGTSGDYAQTNNCPIPPIKLTAGVACTINVTFTPTVAGTRTGTLTINDDAGIQTVSLSGTGVSPAPIASFSQTSINFGTQIVGSTSQQQTITLTNTGTANLTITDISSTGDYFTSQDCGTLPVSLIPSAFCHLFVSFAPSTTGTRAGTTTFTDNASDSPQVLSFTGIGVAPAKMMGTASLQGVATAQ